MTSDHSAPRSRARATNFNNLSLWTLFPLALAVLMMHLAGTVPVTYGNALSGETSIGSAVQPGL